MRSNLADVNELDQRIIIKFDEFIANVPKAKDFLSLITHADIILANEFMNYHVSENVIDSTQHVASSKLSTVNQMEQFYRLGLNKKKTDIKTQNQLLDDRLDVLK
jgi:hypothetical protein